NLPSPLCRSHHRAVHRAGDEKAWWTQAGIDPVNVARKLWKRTRVEEGRVEPEPAVQGCRLRRKRKNRRSGRKQPSAGLATTDMLNDMAPCDDLFHTVTGIAFADITADGHRETWHI